MPQMENFYNNNNNNKSFRILQDSQPAKSSPSRTETRSRAIGRLLWDSPKKVIFKRPRQSAKVLQLPFGVREIGFQNVDRRIKGETNLLGHYKSFRKCGD